jgi:hypothetical protein
MKSILLPVIVLFWISSPIGVRAQALTTGFVGGASGAGKMFDLVAERPILVRALQIALASGTTDGFVRIFTKSGSYAGVETDSAQWSQAGAFPFAAGPVGIPKSPTVLPVPILINAGERRAFYVRIEDGTGFVQSTVGALSGTLVASNGDLRVFEGVSLDTPFGGVTANRRPNVAIHYSIPSDRLSTPFGGGFAQRGFVFDVIAKRSLSITGFQIATQAPFSGGLEIRSKAGTFAGFMDSPGSWTLHGLGTFGTPVALRAGSFVPLHAPLRLSAGERRAFYLRTPDENLSNSGTLGAVGNVAAENENLSVRIGASVAGFFGAVNAPRLPNVVVHYGEVDFAPPGITILGRLRRTTAAPVETIHGVVSDDVGVARVTATFRQARPTGPGRPVTRSLRLGPRDTFSLNLRLSPRRNLATFVAVDRAGRRSAPARVVVVRNQGARRKG